MNTADEILCDNPIRFPDKYDHPLTVIDNLHLLTSYLFQTIALMSEF